MIAPAESPLHGFWCLYYLYTFYCDDCLWLSLISKGWKQDNKTHCYWKFFTECENLGCLAHSEVIIALANNFSTFYGIWGYKIIMESESRVHEYSN